MTRKAPSVSSASLWFSPTLTFVAVYQGRSFCCRTRVRAVCVHDMAYTLPPRVAGLYFFRDANTRQMAQRLTLRTRNPYNTKSNRRRVVKTPNGDIRYLHINKLPTSPKCGDCHTALPGVKAVRPRAYATLSKREKTVQRAYGGSRCANCVRTRYVFFSRSFLTAASSAPSLSRSRRL